MICACAAGAVRGNHSRTATVLGDGLVANLDPLISLLVEVRVACLPACPAHAFCWRRGECVRHSIALHFMSRMSRILPGDFASIIAMRARRT